VWRRTSILEVVIYSSDRTGFLFIENIFGFENQNKSTINFTKTSATPQTAWFKFLKTLKQCPVKGLQKSKDDKHKEYRATF
jgi:hypothetical protein